MRVQILRGNRETAFESAAGWWLGGGVEREPKLDAWLGRTRRGRGGREIPHPIAGDEGRDARGGMRGATCQCRGSIFMEMARIETATVMALRTHGRRWNGREVRGVSRTTISI